MWFNVTIPNTLCLLFYIFSDPVPSVPDAVQATAGTSTQAGQRAPSDLKMRLDPLMQDPQKYPTKICDETKLLEEAYNELRSLSQTENAFSAFGNVVADNLKETNCENQIYTQKLIQDIIFLGRLGRLSSSTKIVE